MIIKKAIEVLDNAAAEMGRPQDPDLFDAMSLGIEAMKALDHGRKHGFTFPFGPLPGETTDQQDTPPATPSQSHF